jgi:excisionase family DNA binding protein
MADHELRLLLLTRKEAAITLSICIRALDELVKAKRIAVVRIGRSVRFDPRDLAAFVDSLKGAQT